MVLPLLLFPYKVAPFTLLLSILALLLHMLKLLGRKMMLVLTLQKIIPLSKKTVGRKSKKEIREEEAERLKTQGNHATIEMSYGRNKRNRLPKGVITPSSLGK